MTDYSEINEKWRKLINDNNLGELFKYTGESDLWEYTGSYPKVRFVIHNKPRSIEWLIKIAYECGRQNERVDQIQRSVRAFENLITPPYSEMIII